RSRGTAPARPRTPSPRAAWPAARLAGAVALAPRFARSPALPEASRPVRDSARRSHSREDVQSIDVARPWGRDPVHVSVRRAGAATRPPRYPAEVIPQLSGPCQVLVVATG